MSRRNFNGVQINQSATILEIAGVTIEDRRNRIMAYDESGKVVLAGSGTVIPIGVALIEAGINDITGKESGKVYDGDDVDIQIKDIGYVLAGTDIAKGAEVAAMKDGLATTAIDGDYVIGGALDSAKEDSYCRIQISKYQKSGGTEKS